MAPVVDIMKKEFTTIKLLEAVRINPLDISMGEGPAVVKQKDSVLKIKTATGLLLVANKQAELTEEKKAA